jgi:hypothetical protein
MAAAEEGGSASGIDGALVNQSISIFGPSPSVRIRSGASHLLARRVALQLQQGGHLAYPALALLWRNLIEARAVACNPGHIEATSSTYRRLVLKFPYISNRSTQGTRDSQFGQ